MTESNEEVLAVCPLCETSFAVLTDEVKELLRIRTLDGLISFQKVFRDVSGMLLYLEEITEDITIGELLTWIKDVLEKSENVGVEHSL